MFASMLLRTALSTQESQAAMAAIARERPSGLLVYTVRHTGGALPRFSIALEPGGPPSAPGSPTATTSMNTAASPRASSTRLS
ncbi:hypothetical protein [Streptomyces sp. ISL-100]|uniref:hypothetical protein n=1 Tax=Streptomyces sp. ISL-100 TaxID=2819173 RepID=UPI001BED347B|nr:hypothetical protein [Streptomyces sp. ISL-100]MBT2398750.1 hypothetical protein [Streptomyces sp. ISL-100]